MFYCVEWKSRLDLSWGVFWHPITPAYAPVLKEVQVDMKQRIRLVHTADTDKTSPVGGVN